MNEAESNLDNRSYVHPNSSFNQQSDEDSDMASMDLNETPSSPHNDTYQMDDEMETVDFDTPPSSPMVEVEEDVICLSKSEDFASHKPKSNWDSLCGSRKFKVMVNINEFH